MCQWPGPGPGKCLLGRGQVTAHTSPHHLRHEAIRDPEPGTPGVSTEESGLFVAAMVSPHDQNKTGIGSGTPSWDHTDQAPVALEDKAFQRRTC